MFDVDSRYATLPVLSRTTATGRQIAYVERRFLPRPEDLRPVARVPVAEGDRLDQLATRVLGDPLAYWRVCDANGALRPDDLLVPGSMLLVTDPT
ncbi:MAG: hypothetical protein IR158_03145 [Cellulomonas sp.]|jgi:hypothetical protein|uniref:hypothetical protein n=1 Tax=Cellulomonas sp. TaxID=40001 RepID=UPI0019F0AE08|nr:hypothetical protein [Cellulomonas sp.]MBF0686751.1 hypothetical protein [Cellulomonas sp.]